MSFGYGASDVLAVGKLAYTVYKCCKDAPGSFYNVSAEVASMYAVLKEVEENVGARPFPQGRQARLKPSIDGCREVLEELQTLVKKYQSLGTQSKRTWDRLGFGSKNIDSIRLRLLSSIVLLNTFLSSSQLVVEGKLNQLLQEFRAGKREGSIMTTITQESLSTDEKDAWRDIRKELADIGLTVAAFELNKDLIMNWFRNAVATGAFEEVQSSEEVGSESSDVPGNDQYAGWSSQGKISLDGLSLLSEPPPSSDLYKNSQNPPSLTRHDVEGIEDDDIDDVLTYEIKKSQLNTISSTDDPGFLDPSRVLINAARSGNTAEIPDLLAKGANINYRPVSGVSPLESAIEADQLETIKILLNCGVDLHARNSIGRTPWARAAMISNEEVVRLLLDHGAKVNQSSQYGNTALHYAVKYNKIEVVRLLLVYGADINVVNSALQTPLDRAIIANDEGKVRLLLENGADPSPDLRSAKGRRFHSALFLAAAVITRKNIFLLLLKHGAKIDAVDRWHETALHAAAQNGLIDGVATLLDYGADATIKSQRKGRERYRAIDYAQLSNKYTIADMLNAHKESGRRQITASGDSSK